MARKVKKKGRRRRPFGINLFVTLFLLFPPIKFIFYSYQYNNKLTFSFELLEKLDYLTTALMFMPIFVGTGLFFVQKWGYILFLIYVFLFTAHNFYKAMLNPNVYNFATLSFIQVCFLSVFYFVSDRIRNPYFKKGFRGWREDQRYPIEIKMNVEGEAYTTTELSASGAQLKYPNCPYEKNQKAEVSFKLWNDVFKMNAGVVWKTEEKVGIAFRGLDKKTKKKIHKILVKYY